LKSKKVKVKNPLALVTGGWFWAVPQPAIRVLKAAGMIN
jgi:hypothetical protein